MRRMRRTPALRSLVKETTVLPRDLVKPFFVVPGTGIKNEVKSLPGQYQVSIDVMVEEAERSRDLGIRSFILFAIPEYKDDRGSSASLPDGIIQQSLQALRQGGTDQVLITDLCFCEYTSHGHCGVMCNGELQNDETLELLAEQALSHARAGADIIAPSGMLDGMVKTLRTALDREGFESLPIMSYAVKFASSFYGPFREAVQSAPEYGDRRGYQMDGANSREALREALLDVEEGADIIMVKPALAYLDIVRQVRDSVQHPLAIYNVSGEYAMVKAAAREGWIDGRKMMIEMLTSFKRAGADIIISYFADEYAEAWQRGDID